MDGEAALRDGALIDRDIATHDDRARALVHDDLCDAVRHNRQVFEIRDEADDVATIVGRNRDVNAAGVRSARDTAELAVDGLHHACCRREIRVRERQRELAVLPEIPLDALLDNGAIRRQADGREVLLRRIASIACHEAARRDRPLRDGINLAIASLERRLHERAALDALRIADGRDRDIDRVALARERRQRRRDHDGRNVVWLQARRVDRDAECFQHVADALHGFLDLV